ncbi:hypothetical protein RJ639_027305 [Escallonia herrerae]|uniref:NADP-dependent oxidoreductase domain-containing protein n=1 Tax=Escallonia herrerae TaxID=1293975 RepID=A0AA89BJ73_9ASTE|nr:hypothetical protein RJ639_027305 [Escallonia herrerae]
MGETFISVPEISLSSGIGRGMPVLGLGTAADPPVESEVIRNAVLEAIEVGYRHFDTAALYNSEQPLGEAVAEAIRRGLIKSREELFINSKLWCSDAHPEHVEVNPCWQQKKLREFCKGNGILVVAYAALGAVGTFYGTNRGMESEVLKEISDARGKTIPQVCLRWAYEQGIGVLVKSFNKDRMKQNLQLFSWELSEEESKKISEIPQSSACLEISLCSGGRKLPVLGLGTATFPPVEPEIVKQAVLEAIKLGYRHFDTASVYQTEQVLGEAIAEALGLGLITSRDELFITSKLWCSDAHGDRVELNPCWQQRKLLEFCRANGIVVAAFSPLGAVGTSWGSNRVMESDVLQEIAKAKGKSVAQICLRWGYEQGAVVVMKSFNKERLKANADIFNWELSEEESKKISDIPQSRGQRGEEFISPDGPIKSLEEFWDGEL